ncbi:GGDEF domain-containing protein [Parvibaculum sp.]|jgi:diguanylate cyclase (GGDEF)-like protein|uniref:GGDEF domain-containing protein n=1 Tax=Parvibaculum sp. TaxID=2024848 RepID=UPI002FDB2580
MAYLKRTAGLTDEHGTPAPLGNGTLENDPQTERFRRSLGPVGRSPTHRHLVSRALAFANETETRIGELNARIRQLEALTQTDELTGLLNRRGFDEIISRNLSSAARYDETGLLAYIDLDDFKAINDRCGHAVGDEVLRAVGTFLHKNIRATDYAARLGGDEFAVLFVRADHRRARERAREMLRAIDELEIASRSHKIRIRASLGLAGYNAETRSGDLFDRADRAMYADKRSGGREARLTTLG